MKLHDVIAAGFSHLAQNRLRAGLSILGILIGIASVLCMMALGDGAKQLVADEVDKLGDGNQIQFTTCHSITRRGRRVPTPDLTFSNTAAPDGVLRPMLIVLGVGGVLLVPAFWYLYAVFKGASRKTAGTAAEVDTAQKQ